jgi:photosystem II stability/assembly factor-like uncharacterized protein
MKKIFTKYQAGGMLILLILGASTLAGVSQSAAVIPGFLFGDLKARQIGPATMSGRISALDAVDRDPAVMYAGSASGGLWKTKNWGTTFKPVFDNNNQCIGAITIDQARPDTVWVGTGEVWVRNSTSVGDGIYRTTNGGETWTRMGLERTERIAKIVIRPNNPDIVYVAALGDLWNSSPDRGLYRTSDGGRTWEKILYVDENTGCSDVAVDPGNPDIMYAGMWEFRRTPWSFSSGGNGSGLFRSSDGGRTWSKIVQGLPEGMLGRVAVAVSSAKPAIVYALVEATRTGLYRSGDRGLSWNLMTTSETVTDRPFYFSAIIPDPVDTNILYKPGFAVFKSVDGGKTFGSPSVDGGNYHTDCHVLYINRKDNKQIYMGTDGGVYITRDGGNTWGMLRNLPVGQFYHVSTDDDFPFNVYGGLQDNGSWYGPSQAGGGISNHDWTSVGYGDGFYVCRDKLDPDIIYWQSQGGYVVRYYKSTGASKSLIPARDKDTKDLRFNWNAPMVFSPARNTMYIGAQYLYKSDNRGDTWDRISPDLTTDNPEQQKQEKSGGLTVDNSSAENHCTIYTINESPLDSLIIWAGTDDGNLQVTTDGGKSWTNVTPNIKGLPAHTWCSYAEPGRFDRNTVFATFDGHRTGDKAPYVFTSADLGKTWTALADTAIKAYCQVIRQDIVKPGLLFLGTEGGLYLSVDNGKSWTRFPGKIPQVPVMDMAFQAREQSLVLATHGRGIMIIDDLTPFRELTSDLPGEDVRFLDSKEFVIRDLAWAQRFDGDDEYTGPTAPQAATVVYYLKDRHIFGPMELKVYDNTDKMVKELPVGVRKGINVVNWSATLKPPKVPVSPQLEGMAMSGPYASPGEYSVRLSIGDKVYESKLRIGPDPRSPYSIADRSVRQEAVMKAYNLLETLAWMDRQVKDIRNGALAVKGTAPDTLSKKLQVLADQMDSLQGKIVAMQVGKITGEQRLREKVAFIYGSMLGYQGRPTDSQLSGLEELARQTGEVNATLGGLESKELAEVNRELLSSGKKEIKITTLEAFRMEP